MAKSKYWDIKPIRAIPAQYRIIYGERSNGKTYGVLKYFLEQFFENGSQFAYIRRWADDIKMKKMQQVFEPLCVNGEVGKITGGLWNGIQYKHGKFYLMATDGEGNSIVSERPCGFTFSLSAMEHDKSIGYPGVKNILYEEFISRLAYIPDEFPIFMNVLSTIIRERDDVDIWMLGNTVSKDCPYFREMGLKHITQQKQGTIDTYSYKKNGMEMLIAVEYTENKASKKSDKYFIFDNPKMEMITGGAWELAIYPHLYEKYTPKQILYMFFIYYRETALQCEIVEGKRGIFIFCHLKTSELKRKDSDLVYTPTPDSRYLERVDITKPEFPIEKRIYNLIVNERICFQDNEIGEVFNDYLKWCRSHQLIRK